MQHRNRRSNKDRSEATRTALIAAARNLFVAKGYAETGTPELVATAGVTRGALYHHFTDKQELFRAVVELESRALADMIRSSTEEEADFVNAIVKGGEAFLEAISAPGRTHLLLVDAPAVLGRNVLDQIDAEYGARTLREGLAAADAAGLLGPLPIDATAKLLSAAYDRAALAIETGDDAQPWRSALKALILGLRSKARAD